MDDTPDPAIAIQEIKEGARFNSWDDVKKSVQKLEEDTGAKFKGFSCHLINVQVRPKDASYNQKLIYKDYTFCCNYFQDSVVRKLIASDKIKS